MLGSRGRRLAACGVFLALATTLALSPAGLGAPDRGRAAHDAAAAVAGGVASDQIDPAVLPQKPTPSVSAAGERRAPRATTLLVAALLAAAVALAASVAGHTRPGAKGTPPLTRRRNCIGLRAPPSLQLA